MREILFQGKRTDNGEWTEGFYAQSGERTYIIFDNGFAIGYVAMKEVDPSTIGQYTGLTDKNGKKIFEGDIVKNGDYTMVVVWYDFCAAFMLAFSVDGDYHEAISNSHIYLEVIGNIHDNPELLGGDGNETLQ